MEFSCLCEQVQLRIDCTEKVTLPLPISLCHCSFCQKQYSYACAVVEIVGNLSVIKGNDKLKRFQATDEVSKSTGLSVDKYRVFCSQCGTTLYSARVGLEGKYRVRAGTLSKTVQNHQMIAGFHKFMGSAPEWHKDFMTPSLSQYPAQHLI